MLMSIGEGGGSKNGTTSIQRSVNALIVMRSPVQIQQFTYTEK